MIILKLASRPSLSLLLCSRTDVMVIILWMDELYIYSSTYLQYLRPTYLIEYVILNDFTYEILYTKNVLVGNPVVLVRDKIHCNKYLGTHRVMRVGYPGSKISTHFNPTYGYAGGGGGWGGERREVK